VLTETFQATLLEDLNLSKKSTS
jgi:hypothetical protein